MNFIEKTRLSERTLFWIIISSSIILVAMIAGSLELYRFQDKRAKATLAAIPTMTAESLEFLYQKGVGYINIGHWQDARETLELIFEVDPNYRDVQSKLVEVEAKMAELNTNPILNLSPTPIQNVSSASTENTNLIDGLIAYYPFNGNANDESGNSNHGRVIGATLVKDRFGNPNSAYSFDGVDDCILANDNPTLDIQNSISLVVWIKTNNSHQNLGVIIAKHHTHRDRSYTLFDATDTSSYYDRGVHYQLIDTVDNAYLSGPYVLDDNWRLVVGTYDESLGIKKLYVDGETMTISNIGPINLMQTPVPLSIGCYLSNSSGSSRRGYFHGLIDDVRIYNRTLSDTEIQILYGEKSR